MAHTKQETPSFLISVRFLLAILAFFAYAVQYTQKINMSVAIVCMIKQENTTKQHPNEHFISNTSSHAYSDSVCEAAVSKKHFDGGEFYWNKQLQGVILSFYFVGYLLTEIPGGWLSLKFGSKIVLAIAILVSSLLTILLPFAARIHVALLIICRFLIGLAHGVVWPAFSGFWVIALPLGGFLCINGFDGGWPSIFYVFGLFGVVWFLIWIVVSSNNPGSNRFIGKKEKDYIEEQTKETMEAFKEGEKGAPWLQILTSKPAAAIFFGHTSSNWGTYLFLTSLPTYMKEVLKFDVKSNGALSALPYLAFWLVIISSGVIGDQLQSFGVKKIAVRRIFNILGLLVPMSAVIGLMFVTCHTKYVGVALLTIGLAFTGCAYGAGFLVNYNDISGIYSGIVFGIGNTFATLPGIIAPYLVGILTKNKTQQEWQLVFGITACIYLAGAIVLTLFTQSDLQDWASRKKSHEDNPLVKTEL